MEKEDLWRRYGQPPQVDAGTALRMLGLRDAVHPLDVVACLYPSGEALDAFAQLNNAKHGHTILGNFPVPTGVVGVLDLRAQLEEMGRPLHDPSEPDAPAE